MRATSNGLVRDLVALQREQDHDGEQQTPQGDGPDARQERLLVPDATTAGFAPTAGEVAGHQRDAQEDEHRPRDLPHRHVDRGLVEAEPTRKDLEVEVAEEAVRDDLEQRVERDEHHRGLAVAARKVVPDEHHRDATRETDDDQPGAVLGQIGQEHPRQGEHQRRTDDPVEHERRAEHAPVGGDMAEIAVADLGQHRIHHQQQTERDRQRHGVDLDVIQRVVQARERTTQTDPEQHRDADPHRQEPVQQREPLQAPRRPGHVLRKSSSDSEP